MKSKLSLLAFLALALLFTLFIEPNIEDYAMQVIMLCGINITLAVSLNLINGHTGQFSLGHAGFMAIGAYTATAITTYARPLLPGLPLPLLFLAALLAAGLLAAAAGLLIGIPSLRLKGDYLAIATLGSGEIIRVVLQNTDALGGPRGMSGIPHLTTFFWTFAVAALSIYIVSALVNSTYGRGFLAVRDDEIAAEAMGINTTKYKVIAFTLGALFAGVAGALYAHQISYISPEGFNFLKSVEIVVMVIVGGMGSTPGVAVAAILLTLLNESLRDFAQYRMVIYAVLLILLMLLRPQGLLGDLAWLRRLIRKKWKPEA